MRKWITNHGSTTLQHKLLASLANSVTPRTPPDTVLTLVQHIARQVYTPAEPCKLCNRAL
jgi:hypothetical protein